MKIIGIVGNVSSGKTTLSNYLKNKGIPIIEADKINHKLILKTDEVKKEVATLFNISSCKVDRFNLRDIILKDEVKRKKLEIYLRPLITQKILDCLNFFKKLNFKTVVIEASVMEELNLLEYINLLVLIRSQKDIRFKRTVKFKKYTELDAELLLKIQGDDKKYLRYNPIILYNNGTIEKFFENIETNLIPLIL